MNTQNTWDSVKKFFEKIGRRNMMIAGAVVLVVGAVAVNWIFFSNNDTGDGYNYQASAGMSTNYGTTLTTTAVEEERHWMPVRDPGLLTGNVHDSRASLPYHNHVV